MLCKCLQAKIAELEASLGKVSAERAALERQRSAGKPPRPPTSGTSSPRGAPGSPFGRAGSGGDAAAALTVASLEIQVCTAACAWTDACFHIHCEGLLLAGAAMCSPIITSQAMQV